MLSWIIWYKTVLTLTLCIAQLDAAVEYTVCTPPMSDLDMTLDSLMVMPQ